MILVIEDDLVTLRITTMLLQRMRLEFRTAQTGAEALALLRTEPIDLIIADLELPDMEGLDLLTEAFKLPFLRDIPVLFCTGHSEAETVQRALALGAVDFVKKPVNVQAFAARLERVLEHVPARWESKRDVMRRLRLDMRGYYHMLHLLRQQLEELQTLAADPQATEEAISSLVFRSVSSATETGALRLGRLLDRLWATPNEPRDREGFAAAMAIELAAIDAEMASAAARPFVTSMLAAPAATPPATPAVSASAAAAPALVAAASAPALASASAPALAPSSASAPSASSK
jgi:CheY-like chemotaxis protein